MIEKVNKYFDDNNKGENDNYRSDDRDDNFICDSSFDFNNGDDHDNVCDDVDNSLDVGSVGNEN